ncbi:MAG: proline dehydrogenase family protein [Candidatus Hodarchaeales archaeon]|jgi:proline dehydrogenase
MPSFLVRSFARAYVAGVGIESGLKKAQELWVKDRLCSTIDMLGEEISTQEEVEVIIQTYFQLINRLAQLDNFPGHISLKPTSLGVDIDKEYCLNNLRRILTKAKENNVEVTLDMEDSHYTDITLDLYHTLKNDFNFGTVLQSRLFRTKEDILSLKNLEARIRICIGVYNENKNIAFTKKSEMKEKLVEYTELLLDHGHNVDIATHDHKYIIQIFNVLNKRKLGPERAEFQFLLGVPRERIQRELIDRGYRVRLYIPFTTEWKAAIAYLRRRLIENPSMIYLAGLDFIGRLFQPILKRRRKHILPPEH